MESWICLECSIDVVDTNARCPRCNALPELKCLPAWIKTYTTSGSPGGQCLGMVEVETHDELQSRIAEAMMNDNGYWFVIVPESSGNAI